MAVVAISRQVGSGGHEIAQLVSQQLDYPLYDRDLIARLGVEAGILAEGEIIDIMPEQHHTQNVLERMFSVLPTDTMPLGAYEASGEGAEDRAVSVVSKTTLMAYDKGNVVIEGRGSQGVLRDKPGVLQVRVVAPLETRVANVMKRDSCSESEAKRKVKEGDASQIDYIQRYFGANIDDPTLYHLIINTGKVTLEAAASTIIEMMNRLFAPGK